MTTSNFEQHLRGASLTKKGRKAAQFILDSMPQSAFMSASSIAKQLNISDVTVIRCARSLGYEGFQDMQKALQDEISQSVEATKQALMTPSERLIRVAADSGEDIMKIAVNNTVKNVEKLVEKNDSAAFYHAANIIVSSRRKFIIGFRGSAHIAEYLSMKLNFELEDVVTITSVDQNSVDRIFWLEEGDCAVIFCLGNYPSMSKRMMDIARERKAKIIVITEEETSPINIGADIVLITTTRGVGFSAYACPILASEIINANIARILWPQRETRSMDIQRLSRETGYYLYQSEESLPIE